MHQNRTFYSLKILKKGPLYLAISRDFIYYKKRLLHRSNRHLISYQISIQTFFVSKSLPTNQNSDFGGINLALRPRKAISQSYLRDKQSSWFVYPQPSRCLESYAYM